jgi:tyrosyl-tRNA synthetase
MNMKLETHKNRLLEILDISGKINKEAIMEELNGIDHDILDAKRNIQYDYYDYSDQYPDKLKNPFEKQKSELEEVEKLIKKVRREFDIPTAQEIKDDMYQMMHPEADDMIDGE